MKQFVNSRFLFLFLLNLTATSLSISCKKDNNAPALALLQHKWQIISLNGEAYRHMGLPGEYFDFGANKQLVELIGNTYDTLDYNVTDGGTRLQLYPLINGAQTGGSLSFIIKTLTSSQLLLTSSATTGPPINILDSLSR